MQNSSGAFDSWSKQAKKWLGDDFWDDIIGLVSKAGPRADVYQTENLIIVIVELPGVRDVSDIHVNVDPYLLTVRGKSSSRYPDASVVQSELFFGNFERTIQLPSAVKTDKITAHFFRGLLEVKLVKQNENKSTKRRVNIKNLD